MTLTIFWTFAILTFTSGTGATCGISSSREWPTFEDCERQRRNFEIESIPQQTPTRRISTLLCELRARQTP